VGPAPPAAAGAGRPGQATGLMPARRETSLHKSHTHATLRRFETSGNGLRSGQLIPRVTPGTSETASLALIRESRTCAASCQCAVASGWCGCFM